jgi:hypothetical protein
MLDPSEPSKWYPPRWIVAFAIGGTLAWAIEHWDVIERNVPRMVRSARELWRTPLEQPAPTSAYPRVPPVPALQSPPKQVQAPSPPNDRNQKQITTGSLQAPLPCAFDSVSALLRALDSADADRSRAFERIGKGKKICFPAYIAGTAEVTSPGSLRIPLSLGIFHAGPQVYLDAEAADVDTLSTDDKVLVEGIPSLSAHRTLRPGSITRCYGADS